MNFLLIGTDQEKAKFAKDNSISLDITQPMSSFSFLDHQFISFNTKTQIPVEKLLKDNFFLFKLNPQPVDSTLASFKSLDYPVDLELPNNYLKMLLDDPQTYIEQLNQFSQVNQEVPEAVPAFDEIAMERPVHKPEAAKAPLNMARNFKEMIQPTNPLNETLMLLSEQLLAVESQISELSHKKERLLRAASHLSELTLNEN